MVFLKISRAVRVVPCVEDAIHDALRCSASSGASHRTVDAIAASARNERRSLPVFRWDAGDRSESHPGMSMTSYAAPPDMPTEFTSPRHPPSATFRLSVWGVLLLAVAALALSNYDSFQLGPWIDDATYVVQARALLALLSARSSLRLPNTRLHVGDLQAPLRLVSISEGALLQVFRIPHG
jgi:hypothetical protein